MSDETCQLLVNLQAHSKECHPYIFISSKRLAWIIRRREAGDWTPTSDIINNILRDFEVIRQRAGVRKCTLHDLRRSAITNWAQELTIQVVQQLAGHSGIEMTRKYYLAVRSEDLVFANMVLNSMLAKMRDD